MHGGVGLGGGVLPNDANHETVANSGFLVSVEHRSIKYMVFVKKWVSHGVPCCEVSRRLTQKSGTIHHVLHSFIQ
jgi:hypothetical protein